MLKPRLKAINTDLKKKKSSFFVSMSYQYEKPTNQTKLFLQFGIGPLRLIPVKFGQAFEK